MKILHITSELDGGGIERLLYNYSLYLPKEIVFDYAICSEKKGILEDKVIENGSAIYHYPRIRLGVLKTIRELQKIIKNGNYDIVQVHADYRSFVALFAAKLAGTKVRIAHSHTCGEPESTTTSIKRCVCTFVTKIIATDLFACGEEAGRWVWGDSTFKKKKVFVMHNAIQTENYKYDEKKRSDLRQKFHIDEKFVIGNVGRLCLQKNQMFLLDAFETVLHGNPNAVLMLIGGGEDETILKEYVKSMKLENNVLFLGVRDNVNELINAFDLFVLPSLYEGLPVTLVEIQANGVASLVSSSVTSEIYINDNIEYIPLSKEKWVNAMSSADCTRDLLGREKIIAAGYDIATESQVIADKYKGMI